MPNAMLTKIGFKKWRSRIGQSSDLLLACQLNTYIIDRETAIAFQEKQNQLTLV